MTKIKNNLFLLEEVDREIRAEKEKKKEN